MLTAHEIRSITNTGGVGIRIVIDPFDLSQLNPNSYNLTLSPHMKWYPGKLPLDVRHPPQAAHITIPEDGFVLEPGELYLGCTQEYTESHNLIPMINGRSSLARLGISVHQTGGFGDIGFCGNWTLEITCIKPVRIYAGMKFAQVCWFRPYGTVDMEYHGKYQHSKSEKPIDSRISTELLSGALFEECDPTNPDHLTDPRTAAGLKGDPNYKDIP
jgi:dCTP deaminase